MSRRSAIRRPLRLDCGVQHYAWGDTDFIPRLLGIDNVSGQPYAELWIGAHPDLPSQVELDGRRVGLDALIAEAPEQILGPEVASEFGARLPFLLKILSAKEPLSIQAHPSLEEAKQGFARENAAGIPLSSSHRNYRDPNHKPELIAALTDFYALRGFRPLDDIALMLRTIPAFKALGRDFAPVPARLEQLLRGFMTLPQEDVNAILGPLVQDLLAAHARRPFTREEREYWVLRAHDDYSMGRHHDRGLFAIYLLNLLHLRPGDATYLPAGVLHSYLEGSGVEIMANSNNVLRGGLTAKHVDVSELLALLTYEGGEPEIIRATPLPSTAILAYRTPVREFELDRIELDAGARCEGNARRSAEILIVVEADPSGTVVVESADGHLELERGGVALLPHGTAYALGTSARATLYKARCP